LCPVHLWNRAGKQHLFSFDWKDFAYPAFSPNGKILVVAGQNGVIRIYDTATAKELVKIKTEAITINPSCPVISPDSKTLAWLDGARRIKLWNVADGREMASWQVPELGRNYHLQISPDGKHLALSTEKGVLICDMAGGKEPTKIL